MCLRDVVLLSSVLSRYTSQRETSVAVNRSCFKDQLAIEQHDLGSSDLADYIPRVTGRRTSRSTIHCLLP
jgi:hypothetical protein